MSIYQYKKIKDWIHGINEQMVSSFLFEGEDKALLMDTGMDFFDIKKFVASKTDKELIVFNSHFHPDHSNGNNNFDKVYITEADCPTFTTNDVYFKLVDDISSAIYEKVNGKIKTTILKKVVDKALMTKPGSTKYEVVKDGHEFDLGGKKLIVKSFPGHTPGSATLLDPEDKIIFAGDSCNMGFWAWTNPEMNLHDYAKTCEKYYKEVKKAGYKKMIGSHVPFANKISFIKDYGKWVDKLTPEKALVKFNMPGAKSPFCVAMKPCKHGAYCCFYYAHQCDKK